MPQLNTGFIMIRDSKIAKNVSLLTELQNRLKKIDKTKRLWYTTIRFCFN